MIIDDRIEEYDEIGHTEVAEIVNDVESTMGRTPNRLWIVNQIRQVADK